MSVVATTLYWTWFQRHYRPLSDANHYDGIARNIAAGRGFTHVFPGIRLHATAFRPPLYPSLLGLVYRLTGARIGAGMALNLALGAAAAVALYALVHEIAGERAGVLAGICFAVYPPLLANNVALLTEPLGMVLLFGSLWAALRGRVWAAGLIAGLFALTWTSGQLYCVILAGWVLMTMGWKRAAALALTGIAVVTPWCVRNELRLGTPSINTSNGFNLTATYSKEANSKKTYFVDETVDPRFDTVMWRRAQLDEARWDQLLRRHGIDGFVANPGHAFTLMHHNIGEMLERKPWDTRLADTVDGRARTVRDVGVHLFPVVTVLGLIGLAGARRRRGVPLLVGVTTYFVVLDLLTVMAPRLRGPFDAACCVGLGVLADRVIGWARGGLWNHQTVRP
ncbi:MAG: hypothetical protein NVSMB12_17630 [Acidimicrobiales bacterium]